MRLKLRCLMLLLILAPAWVQDVQPKACIHSIPTEMSPFQRGFALISVEHRIDVLEQIELSRVATVDSQPSRPEPLALHPSAATWDEAVPRLFSSTDLCYLLMSLQW